MKSVRLEQIVFAVLIFAAFFVGLGALPLVGPDEPRYAQVAREMFQNADFITPTLGGFEWFEKPALLYWLQIASFKIFGVNEFSARFGSAVFGILTVLTIYALARNIESVTNGKEHRTNDEFSFWSLIVSASSFGLLIFSHAASFDIILTFPLTAALTFFYFAEVQNPKSKIQNHVNLTVFYFFIGVALLAKGLIGAILPFGIIFWYFVFARKLPSKAFVSSLFWGFFVTTATAATWYLPMYLRHGWKFIDEFFVQHHFARYTSNKYAHVEPFWFFWVILPALCLPWTPFLAVYFFNFIKSKQSVIRHSPSAIFLLCWLFVPLLFFTFSGSKLPGYILPALPAALVLTSWQAARFTENNLLRAVTLKLVAAFVLALVPILLYSFAEADFVKNDTAKFLIETAREKNFVNEKIANLHDTLQSLEFYAAGRVIHDEHERIKKFEGVPDLIYLLKQQDEKLLILVPPIYLEQLTENPDLQTEIVAENRSFALVAATER